MLKPKRILAAILTVALVMASALPASAANSASSALSASTSVKSIKPLNAAARNVEAAALSKEIPAAPELLEVVREANSTKIAIGDVDQNVVDFFDEHISFNGIGVLTDTSSAAPLSTGTKTFSINVYQISEGGELVSANEALSVARSRPLTHTYQNTYAAYNVTGALTINLSYQGTSVIDIRIDNISVMSSWSGSVSTTKIELGSYLEIAAGAEEGDQFHDTVSPVVNGRWTSFATGFEKYYHTTNVIQNYSAGADFYLSNGQIYTLVVVVRARDEPIPYDGFVRYNDPYVQL